MSPSASRLPVPGCAGDVLATDEEIQEALREAAAALPASSANLAWPDLLARPEGAPLLAALLCLDAQTATGDQPLRDVLRDHAAQLATLTVAAGLASAYVGRHGVGVAVAIHVDREAIARTLRDVRIFAHGAARGVLSAPQTEAVLRGRRADPALRRIARETLLTEALSSNTAAPDSRDAAAPDPRTALLAAFDAALDRALVRAGLR